jgi:tetratricopeptide (TPR) repeat protein
VRVQLQLPGHSLDDVKVLADETLDALSRLDDQAGLAVIWWAQGWMTWLTCQAAGTERALARSMEFARKIGSSRIESHSVNLYLGAALFGPMPVGEAVERCLEFRRRHHDRQRIVASCARALAVLRAMQGEFDEARRLMAVDQSILSELGMRYQSATAAEAYGLVELLAGEPDRAERVARSGFLQLERMGDTSALPTLAALLGEALVALERYDEAVAVTDDARRHADSHDLGAQVQWRLAHAKALAWLGRDKRALKIAQDAVRLAERTDFVTLHGDALTTLGEVNRLGGRRAESAAALTHAVRLYDEKGNAVAAARARVALRAASRSGRKDSAAANVG